MILVWLYNFLLFFPSYLTGKVFCSVCNKRCKGDTLKIEEKFVHHKCFHCTKCKKKLQKGGFFVREQRFYCPDDYQSSFGVTCEACHAYVEGEAVTVLGKTFHTHCFRCSTCGRLFSSGERTTIIDGTYYCVSCATQISNGLPSSHPTSELESVTPSLSSPSKSKTYPERGRKDTISSTVSWSQKTLPSGLRPGAPPDASQVDEPVDSSLTNGVVKEYPLVSDQLTVQIHENGYLNAVPDLGKQKTARLLYAVEGMMLH
ncbi:Actin binding LIM protein family member 2 [Fasciola gigantica]|uniref:Actin binding LIM protein family member 2 n=1 Tax=Fasciola gigantica TaxID=46835 RepID=A0A504YZ32_FASGI|nr:Actin binding LIM protein family member 2 [Fasciola gigantica]